MRFAIFVVLFASALAIAQPPIDSTAVDVTYLSSIRKDLACYCGCGMTVQDCLGGMICSESRALSQDVVQMIQAGKSREQILQAMVAKHGEKILSAPTKEGFNLTAWILPFVALIAGGYVVTRVVSRWKRQTPEQSATVQRQAAAPSDDPYQQRFEKELKDFES